jgi:hypothetical protein
MPQAPVFHPDHHWSNFHQTYSQVQQGSWDLFFPANSADGKTVLADLRETTRQMHAIIAQAKQANIPLRAVGSRWSLSAAPATSGWTINTNRLRGRMRIDPALVDPAYAGTADRKSNLFLFQCGNSVADVNKVLESPALQRALHTSGAANGQTIAGATSTGTHGSALAFGALHDHIVGLHLVAPEGRHYWIERGSYPVMTPAWVNNLGATLKRTDDDLFNAAVVSMGAFGFIESVLIETAPRYLLDCRSGRSVLDEDLWAAIGGLDFTKHGFFGGVAPYFFQAVINPATDEVLLNANYKIACPPGYQPVYGLTQDPDKIGPGFDSLSTVGFILDRFPGLIPRFSRLAADSLFDTKQRIGTPGEIYGFKAPQLHVASGSIAVALADARRALEALIQLYRDIGPVPLVLGCRYVRKSPALLAFNRFPTGLMISIDGVDGSLSRAYFAASAARIEAAGISFTQHWGKTNAYTPARVSAAYKGNLQKWKDARRQVLRTVADRQIFNNDYTVHRGLAD